MKNSIFTTEQWIAGLGGMLSMSVTVVAFVFMTFSQKGDTKEIKDDVLARLNSIEKKQDEMLQRTYENTADIKEIRRRLR